MRKVDEKKCEKECKNCEEDKEWIAANILFYSTDFWESVVHKADEDVADELVDKMISLFKSFEGRLTFATLLTVLYYMTVQTIAVAIRHEKIDISPLLERVREREEEEINSAKGDHYI